MSVSVSEIEQYIRENSGELVTTHVFHVVAGECDQPGAVRTECGYYLKNGQYDERKAFDETLTTGNHLCHHCTNEIRSELEDS